MINNNEVETLAITIDTKLFSNQLVTKFRKKVGQKNLIHY